MLISVEQSTCLMWEQGGAGHWVLRLPASHTTGRDPTQERAVQQHGAERSAASISITCGLAETRYELSGT